MNKKTLIALVLVVVIVVTLVVGIVLYYNSEIANLKKPELVAEVNVSEVINELEYDENDPSTYNHLSITGAVTNTGLSTAYNAGLHVVATDVTSNVVVNMTVPLVAGTYGLAGNNGPSTLSSLSSQETSQVQLAIYHKGVASSWTVTPVWTNHE